MCGKVSGSLGAKLDRFMAENESAVFLLNQFLDAQHERQGRERRRSHPTAAEQAAADNWARNYPEYGRGS